MQFRTDTILIQNHYLFENLIFRCRASLEGQEKKSAV